MANDTPSNFLTPASVRLQQFTDFKLIGRQADLDILHDTLMRKSAGGDEVRNNVVAVGQSGVGLSSLILSLEAAKQDKEDITTPIEILDKNYFYLDVKGLFSLGGGKEEITKGFESVLATLRNTPNSVLIIEDTDGFVKGIANNQAPNVVSQLMKATATNHEFQTIFMSDYEHLGTLLTCDTDIAKSFALQSVSEPPKDELRAILEYKAAKIAEANGITIDPDAINSLVELTEKYPGIGTRVGFAETGGCGQPKAAIEILQNAAGTFARTARTRPPGLDELEQKLADVAAIREDKSKVTGREADDMTPEELEAYSQQTTAAIEELKADWKTQQLQIRNLRIKIQKSEVSIGNLSASIATRKNAGTAKAQALQACAEIEKSAQDQKAKDEAIQKIKDGIKTSHNIDLVWPPKEVNKGYDDFNKIAANGGYTTEAIKDDEKILVQAQAQLTNDKNTYAKLMNKEDNQLVLTDTQVLAEFSRLSRIEMSKLKQDENTKFLNLEGTLGKRVFGQDAPLKGIANAVKVNKAGLKGKDEAVGRFFLLGPTGTGKTETARALAEALFDTEEALIEFPMNNYGEENSVTQLVGAPPGYKGYEEGGELIKAVRERPSSVILFDEVEKAHPKIMDTFMGITDEHAFLIDRRTGQKVSFADTILIFTSNVGAKFFMDPTLSFEEASKRAIDELRNNSGFRPEFLARLKVFCYGSLQEDQIAQIAKKNFTKLEDMAIKKGITLTIPYDTLKKMSMDVYTPWTGGRGPRDFIRDKIKPFVAEEILKNPGVACDMEVTYIPGIVREEEKAKIRITVEDDESYDIKMEMMKDDKFKHRLMSQCMRENPGEEDTVVVKKVNDTIDAMVKEKLQERIDLKIKELEVERAVVDVVPVVDGQKAAPKAVNSNTPAPTARAAGQNKPK